MINVFSNAECFALANVGANTLAYVVKHVKNRLTQDYVDQRDPRFREALKRPEWR